MVRSRLKILIAERNLERIKANQPVLTIRQIAQDARLAPSTVNGLTSMRANRIDFDTLNALCAYFGVQPGDILVYTPDIPPG
jgi:DNA-binding Xre family transcriptional regulator